MNSLLYVTILDNDWDVLLGDLERLINQNNMPNADKKLYTYLISILMYCGDSRSDRIIRTIDESNKTKLEALITLSQLISIPIYTIERVGVFEIVKYVNGIPVRSKLTNELLDGAITNILKSGDLLEVKDE